VNWPSALLILGLASLSTSANMRCSVSFALILPAHSQDRALGLALLWLLLSFMVGG
jgi:hypothetical protein